MKRLIEVHVAGIKWLSRLASALTHWLYACLPHSASLPYSRSPSTAFPSFNSYSTDPKQRTQLSLSLSVVITLTRDVGSVQGVNQSSHRNQLPAEGTLQNDLLPGNIAPKIFAQISGNCRRRLRRLRRRICAIHQAANCCPAPAPTVCNRMRQGIPLCVAPLSLTTSAYVIQWNECFIGLMELTRGCLRMEKDGLRGLSPGYSKVYRNEKGQFNLICPNTKRERGRERDMQKGCAQNAAIIHTCGQGETHTHTHPHTWAARSPHAKGVERGCHCSWSLIYGH